MKTFLLATAAAAVLLLAGCSTLAVKTPESLSFVSTGDYTPGVKTVGVVQAKKTVWMPFYSYDYNKVKQELYEELLNKAKESGATGVTNINFFYNIYPITAWTVILVWTDCYIEGFAVVKAPDAK